MSAIVDAGMEKLCVPANPSSGLELMQQLSQPGVKPGQLMQGIAAQLLERSQAVTKMLKV